MKNFFSALLLVATACVTVPVRPPARVTTNPDVVRGCTFLGNVETGVWGTLAGGNNRPAWANERWLRKDTEDLGGNVVYVTSNNGTGASGEAYLCR